tara:strand:+ start:423 stop:1646 length:1224 start_codon:yes stop_codon:yes gene_type:complete
MADSIWYVDPDASGANDGTSWTDAYENLVGATSLQTALDQANDADNTTIYVRLSTSSTFDMSTGTGLAVSVGGSPSGANPQVNKWVKIIACDAAGDPIVVANRGTYLDIKATAAVTTMLKYTGDADRVAWFGFHFDGNNGTATNCFYHLNSETSGTNQFHMFINCKFNDGNTYSATWQSEMRGLKFVDCVFVSDNATSTYNPLATANTVFIRCEFLGDYQYTFYSSASYGHLFYQCIFDPQGDQRCIRENASYMNNYINCAFVNFSNAAISSDAQNNFSAVINCYFEGIDTANDEVFEQLNTDDSPTYLAMNCASNLDTGLFDDDGYVLAPYMTASDMLHDNESTVGAINRAGGDYALKDLAIRAKGMDDLNGVSSEIGPTNRSKTSHGGASGSGEELYGSPITGAF